MSLLLMNRLMVAWLLVLIRLVHLSIVSRLRIVGWLLLTIVVHSWIVHRLLMNFLRLVVWVMIGIIGFVIFTMSCIAFVS